MKERGLEKEGERGRVRAVKERERVETEGKPVNHYMTSR